MSESARNAMMRAVAYRKNLPIDHPGSLEDVELPVPRPGARDLLVRVEAVSVNPVDVKVRAGTDPGGEPKVLGWDAAGTVEAVGDAVEGFAPGDEVYYAGAIDRPGSDSRFHLVDERIAARKPVTLSFGEAAALPLTALTAWEALFERLGLRRDVADEGGTLLVTGAAGGVGSIALQLARALTGVTVIGTASRPETAEWAREMGAHHVVDHHRPLAPQLAEVAPGGITHVLSTNGTEAQLPAYAEALRPFGHVVAIDDYDSLPVGVLKPKSISFHWEFMFTRSLFGTGDMAAQQRILARVARLVDRGVLRTTVRQDLGPVDAANLARAHGIVESGSAIGKIVLSGFA